MAKMIKAPKKPAKESPELGTWNTRKNLKAEERHQENLSKGRYLVYRRPKSGGAGSWAAYWCNLETGKKVLRHLGIADDFDPADGGRVLDYGQAQEKAREEFLKLEHQAIHGDESLPTDGPLTVAQAMERYLARIEAKGGKSVKDMRQRAALWIVPTLGGIEVAKLTRAKVENWHQSIAESERKAKPKKAAPKVKRPRKKKEPASQEAEPAGKAVPTEDSARKRKATSNRILSILKAALTCARKQGWVLCSGDAWELVDPFHGVEEPRQRYLLPEEQVRLLNAIDAPDFRRLVAGALSTGCRYGELCRVKVEDFDPSGAGSILIREAKAGKPRRVILTKEGRAFFESITAGRPGGECIFVHEAHENRGRKEEKVIREWRRSEQHRPMREACKAAGLPEMGFHQLRHSYASALVAAGMPLALVAKLTGHADTRMLERHYAHLATSDLSRALEALAPSLGLPIENVTGLKPKKQA